MPDLDLAELRRLLAEASPVPLSVSETEACYFLEPTHFRADKWEHHDPERDEEELQQLQADARLIAAAVNALPALLDRLEAAGKALRVFGDHRWKCDISRGIRAQKPPGGETCSCGWDEFRAAIAAYKEPK